MAQNFKALTHEKGSLHYNILQPILWVLAGIMHALPSTAHGKHSYLHRDLCVSIHSDTPSVPTLGLTPTHVCVHVVSHHICFH